ncbi:MAG: ATP-binding protein [Brumimicrobium sp.]|nr:ATP-binding protein [Brumimicrobium sp.]
MKKIVYQDYTSLENCTDEPIQFLGSIQPFGALISLDKKDFSIHHCSSNTDIFFGVSPEKILGCAFEEFATYFEPILDKDFLRDTSIGLFKNPSEFKINGSVCTVVLHKTEDYFLIEIEPLPSGFRPEHDLYNKTSEFVHKMNDSQNFKSFAGVVAEEIQSITGFDRVMIYRFDEDFNGEVFAESVISGLEPFLGLHYPHTDIPAQARELYKKVQLRIVPDVDYTPVPMVSRNDSDDHRSLNLGSSVLRSVSPIHIQYLRNMGVGATLTVSIMINDQLWGLVACHNRLPKKVLLYERMSALVQVDFFAAQIKRWERSEEYDRVQEKEHIYLSIIEEIEKHGNTFETVTSTPYFLGLTESTGGVLMRDGIIHVFGETPGNKFILELHNWMKSRKEDVFLTNEFSKRYPRALKYEKIASGLLYYSLDFDSDSCLMWFRKQLSEGKKWGGRPEDTDKMENTSLTPRNSFKAWEENVAGKSARWYSHEIQAGLRMGNYLEREIYIRNLKKQKEQLEQITHELQISNEELSQFNWISSHDMKEPLRKIRLFIDQIKLENTPLSEVQNKYFSRIDAAAERMQQLINDLLNYSKLNEEEVFHLSSLNDVIHEVLKNAKSPEEEIFVEVDRFPDIQMIPYQMDQLFSNLISNSIKFRARDRKCLIQIRKSKVKKSELRDLNLNPDRKYLKIVYLDNGIGFDSSFNEKIFEVFQRLHNQREYEGTGIGLAICKKIVETHQGSIRAFGQKEKGVQFEIILPLV